MPKPDPAAVWLDARARLRIVAAELELIVSLQSGLVPADVPKVLEILDEQRAELAEIMSAVKSAFLPLVSIVLITGAL